MNKKDRGILEIGLRTPNVPQNSFEFSKVNLRVLIFQIFYDFWDRKAYFRNIPGGP